jgi:hypothetical protein
LSATARIGFVHPHALNGVQYIALPPPPYNKQQKKQKNITFLRYFLIIPGKTPSADRNGFFYTHQKQEGVLR